MKVINKKVKVVVELLFIIVLFSPLVKAEEMKSKVVSPNVNVKVQDKCSVYHLWNCLNDKDCDCIPDKDDKCPMEKENYNGIDDQDGCPEKITSRVVLDLDFRDSDNDGILDRYDLCPFTPEDLDGDLDSDGCPEERREDGRVEYITKKTARGIALYLIQVGSFKYYINATKQLKKILAQKVLLVKDQVCIEKVKIKGKEYYRILVGPFRSGIKAQTMLKKIKKSVSQDAFLKIKKL
jgi:hypothetical protein